MKNNPITKHLEDISTNGDHSLLQRDAQLKAIKELELPLEGILMKTNELVENTKPKDVQEVKINGISVITLKGDPGNVFDDLTPEQKLEIKGEKGDDGKTPTNDELISLIKPLIPEPIPGDDGETPTEEYLLSLIQPLIPEPVPGDDGDDGVTPSDEKLISLIKPLIPKPVTPKSSLTETAEKILQKIKGKISYEDLKDKPNIETFVGRQSSRSYAASELTDISMQGIAIGQVLQWDGTRFIPYTPSASGFTQVFGEDLTPQNPTGSSFTLAHTPTVGTVRLYKGGAYQQGGAGKDYTISGATITLSTALQLGEILLADYNY